MSILQNIRLSAFLRLPHFDIVCTWFCWFKRERKRESKHPMSNVKLYRFLLAACPAAPPPLSTSAFTSTLQLGRTLCVFRELYGKPFASVKNHKLLTETELTGLDFNAYETRTKFTQEREEKKNNSIPIHNGLARYISNFHHLHCVLGVQST